MLTDIGFQGHRVMVWLVLSFLITCFIQANNRSLLRPAEPLPRITTYWAEEGSRRYSLTDSHLEEGPLFKTFNKDFFYHRLLPEGAVQLRHKNQLVEGKKLATYIERFVAELRLKHRKF